MSDWVTLEDVQAAHARISPYVRSSPLIHSRTFSDLAGVEIYLKCENLQRTGSFKIRGATNKILSLTERERTAGVVAASAGNHAQGVALAAKKTGIRAAIVMPEGAPISKIAATRGYGAEVVLAGHHYDDAYLEALELREERGATYIHAFDDPAVIAGQGTIGLEILDQLPGVGTVVVPVGGGGLISGISAVVKSVNPRIDVIGVQAQGQPSMFNSTQAGRPVEAEGVGTIADGIAVKGPGEITFRHIRRFVDAMTTVTDDQIARTILLFLERAKMLVEGAGAVSMAALLAGLKEEENLKEPVVAVVSGGNIDVNLLSRIIERGLAESGRFVRLRTTVVDQPGALQRLLQVVARVRANVISVAHDRLDLRLALGRAGVELTLETRDRDHIQKVINKLESEGYPVLKL